MPMSATPLDTSSGEKRQFVFRSCLGRGGFGEVYRASMVNTNGLQTDVAVKVLHNDLDTDSQSVQRLRDEGRMLGALVHPAILRVYDLVVLDGRVGLVTEYIEGQDLSDCVRGDSPMPPRAVAAVVGRVADALRAAWETPTKSSGKPLHLIHRDIKPQNIRIGTQGDVKLLDFGVARSSRVGREAQTGTGHMVGSYLYMAPECLLENQFGRESDIFALGVTMFECLAQRRLFKDLSLRELYVMVLKDDSYTDYLNDHLAQLTAPEPVVLLLKRMLARAPVDRPTAAEVSALCDDLVDGLAGPTLRRWCKQYTWAEPLPVNGLLDGRTITEATMVLGLGSEFSREIPTGRRPALIDWRAMAGLSLVVFVLLVAASVTLTSIGVASFAVLTGSNGGLVNAPVAASIPLLETTEWEKPERLVTAGEVTPPPAQPQPSPAPSSRNSGTVFLSTKGNMKAKLRLVGAGGIYYSGQHPASGTYSVQGDWKDDGSYSPTSVPFTVDVRPGQVISVSCSVTLRKCDKG